MIRLTKEVTISPFDTVYVLGKMSFRKHSKCLNIMVEKLEDSNYALVVPIQTYTMLKFGSSRVNFEIHNLSARIIQVQSKMAIAKFSAVNAVPDILAPHVTNEMQGEEGDNILQLLPEDKQTKLFEKVDLSGTESWTSEQRTRFINYSLNLVVCLLWILWIWERPQKSSTRSDLMTILLLKKGIIESLHICMRR